MEYLVAMTTHVQAGTPAETVEQVRAREAARSRELAAQQYLLRLWRPPLRPGEWRSLGLFAAPGDDQLEEVLASMPLRVWRSDEVTPLQPHPNDPGQPPRPGATEFLTTFTITIPAAPRARPLTRRTRPRRTGPRRLGRAGIPAPAVEAARIRAGAGPVAGPGPG